MAEYWITTEATIERTYVLNADNEDEARDQLVNRGFPSAWCTDSIEADETITDSGDSDA